MVTIRPSTRRINAAKADVLTRAGVVDNINGMIDATTKAGGQITAEMLEQKAAAEAAYKASVQQFGVARGGLVASAKQLGSNIAGVFSRGERPEINSVMDEAKILVEKGRAGFLEKWAGKPVRFAARHAVGTLIVGGLATVALVGSFFKGRAEKRTMENAQTEVNAAAARAQANAYTITPEEYAAMEARMRGNGGNRGGHADAVTTAREQAAAAQAPIAQSV